MRDRNAKIEAEDNWTHCFFDWFIFSGAESEKRDDTQTFLTTQKLCTQQLRMIRFSRASTSSPSFFFFLFDSNGEISSACNQQLNWIWFRSNDWLIFHDNCLGEIEVVQHIVQIWLKKGKMSTEKDSRAWKSLREKVHQWSNFLCCAYINQTFCVFSLAKLVIAAS